MITVIVAPDQKAFVPAVLMLRHHFLSQGIDPYVVCGNVVRDVLLGFGVVTHSDVALEMKLEGEAHLVHIQLNSLGTKSSFDKVVRSMLEHCYRVKISLYPDGLGNASWGERLDLQYIAEHGWEGIHFAGFFSFGFVHSTTQKLAGEFPITTLDYRSLQKAVSGSDSIQKIIAPAAEALIELSSIIIPFRPWCTRQFHSGIYDFGDAGDLSRIYSDLIHIAHNDGFEGSPVYFRPDERFQAESESVMNSLAKEFEVVDLSELYPQWLTLEPLLSVICTRTDHKRFAMINLDSTSFQSVPFLASKHTSATGYVGARDSSLEAVIGGTEFAQRKLTGKIKDFERRYRYFQSIQRVSSVEHLDTNLLRVVV